MLSGERQFEILDFLKKNKSATTKELSLLFGVSESTIRRDLTEMSNKKLVERTHKGAILKTSKIDESFIVKYNYMTDEKKSIAKKALDFVHEGDMIAISGGTTAYFFAEELINSQFHNLTIITYSINIADMLIGSKKEFKLIIAGGVPVKGSYECTGLITIEILRQFNVDKYFLGVNGIDQSGVTFLNFNEAEVARELVKLSDKTYILCDHTKFGIKKRVNVCSLGVPERIITDYISEEDMDEYKNKGARIISLA